MRMLVAVVLVVCACDQGIKPKPAVATPKAADVHLPDGRFTAGAWAAIAPVLTFRRAN